MISANKNRGKIIINSIKLALLTVIAVFYSQTVRSETISTVKVLITTPLSSQSSLKPVLDVFAGSLIREAAKVGTAEVIPRKKADDFLAAEGKPAGVGAREEAQRVGAALGAHIVIYSTIDRKNDFFNYKIYLLEVERDIIQRSLSGSFPSTYSPNEIGRRVNEEFIKISRYIPLPSEIIDPGGSIRDVSVDPEKLMPESIIKNFPPPERYGITEQILSYFRIFPGEEEYKKFDQQKSISRLITRDELDPELTQILNEYYMLGDFVIRYNLQAYLIKDCSVGAINVLLANKIPVFVGTRLLTGYSEMRMHGYCLYHTHDNQHVEALEMTHRSRITVMFVAPRPGKRLGLSKNYLEKSIAIFRDEYGKVPTLVEVKESMFDIIPSSLD